MAGTGRDLRRAPVRADHRHSWLGFSRWAEPDGSGKPSPPVTRSGKWKGKKIEKMKRKKKNPQSCVATTVYAVAAVATVTDGSIMDVPWWHNSRSDRRQEVVVLPSACRKQRESNGSDDASRSGNKPPPKKKNLRQNFHKNWAENSMESIYLINDHLLLVILHLNAIVKKKKF